METWRNWAGTEAVTPVRVLTPRSTEDVVAAVKGAVREGIGVKAVGSGHSFTGAALAPGVQLRPHGMERLIEVDGESGLVTVEAGIPLHRLNPLLAEHGLALETMGDIDRQTIAGATATGTHGSSRLFGGISTQIRGLELVTGDGSVITCSPAERSEIFEAARISVGALGIVTKVTLQCVPLYALRAVDAKADLDQTLAGLDSLVDSNDHFEFFWFPHTSVALTRSFERLPGDTELRPLS